MSPTDEDGAAIGGGDGNHRGLHDGFLPALKMESHFTASRISVRHESHRPQLEQLNRIPTDILEPDHKLRRGLDVGKISASENGQLVATASGRTGSTGSRKTVSERRDFSGQGSIGRIDQGRRGFATSEGRTKDHSTCLFILSITLSVECLKSLPDPPNAPSLAPIDRAQAE